MTSAHYKRNLIFAAIRGEPKIFMARAPYAAMAVRIFALASETTPASTQKIPPNCVLRDNSDGQVSSRDRNHTLPVAGSSPLLPLFGRLHSVINKKTFRFAWLPIDFQSHEV